MKLFLLVHAACFSVFSSSAQQHVATPTNFVTFSDISFQDLLQIAFSNALPPSQLTARSSYRATFTESLLSNRASGLFRSEEECDQSSQAAFIFFFQASSAQSSEDSVTTIKGGAKSKVTLPKAILDIISTDKEHFEVPAEVVKESSVDTLKSLLEELN